MRQAATTAALVMLVVGFGATKPSLAQPNRAAVERQKGALRALVDERAALMAAVILLPRQPRRIAVIDATRCRPGVRDYILTLDAFRVPRNDVIYVVRQSDLLRRARIARGIYLYMLAAVIWHEMAHLEGADESAARMAEEDQWTRFIRDGSVDQMVGLRYLQALRNRQGDLLPSL